ncbi:MAG: alpha/beta hydrolase, partial [Clostridia bacterium]|nr:alpha/beta hydrolase [Clostridia bacterium]
FFPENLKDIIDALNFLETIKDEFNLDLENVTITGDSSGGHLAACVGCAASVPEYCQKLGLPALNVKPVRCIFISGAFSFETMYRIPLTHTLMVRYFSGQPSRKAFRNWEFYKEADPYNYLTSAFPPSYNSGGQLDILCAGEAKRMAKKLTEAGVANEYYVGQNIFNNMHCYVLRTPFKPARKDMTKIMDWYCRAEKELGVDMSENFKRVAKSLEVKSK